MEPMTITVERIETITLHDPVQPHPGTDVVLPAELTRNGTQMRVWCRYCDDFHLHGYSPSEPFANRAAHCLADDSPYRRSGYTLVVVPEGTVTLPPPRTQRRKPFILHGDSGPYVHGWHDEPGDPCKQRRKRR